MVKRESGQALVLVLLSLSVVLTIVLFVLSRTVTDISISSRQEEAVRAFSAAEAGIEKALVIGMGLGGTFTDSNIGYTTTVSEIAQGARDFQYPLDLSSGDSATFWFVAHDSSGNVVCDATHTCFSGPSVEICWGKPGTDSTLATTPAIEASIFYTESPGDYTTLKIARGVYDPNPTRASSNGFVSADGVCAVGDSAFSKTLSFSALGIPAGSYGSANGLQFIKFRLFYNTDQSQPVTLNVNLLGDGVLPSQGISISSSGTAGNSNRRLDVFQGWPEPPSIFDYAIYSSSGLTK